MVLVVFSGVYMVSYVFFFFVWFLVGFRGHVYVFNFFPSCFGVFFYGFSWLQAFFFNMAI